jgi:hypothetical protein
VPCPFNSLRQLTLMLVAITGCPAGYNFTLLGQKPNQSFFIPEINVNITGFTKTTDSLFSL